MTDRHDVVIVGGGAGGLMAALEASNAGHSVLLLEAGNRLGGAVQGVSLGGVTVDVGAESYAITRPDTSALIEQLGLTHLSVEPRRSDSRLVVPHGTFAMPHALLGIPTNPLAPEVVAIIGKDAAELAAQLDEQQVPKEWDPALTLGALVRQRLGDAVADLITTPVVGGVHALHPDLAEAEAISPGITSATVKHGGLANAAMAMRSASGIPGSAIRGLRGGMSVLASAVIQSLEASGVDLRTGVTVLNVSQSGTQWTVQTTSGVFTADQVVVALDARSAASVLTAVPEVHEPLSQMYVGDVIVFAAVISSELLDQDPLGSGALIAPSTPGLRAKAITHASSKWGWIRESYGPGRHMIRLSYGRDGVIQESLNELPDIAHADLELLLGSSLPVFEDTYVARWSGSLLHPRVGHRAKVAQLRAAVAGTPGLSVAVSGMAGNGLAGTIGQARASIDKVRN
ncbi:MAG: protoporphyrinogen oxidase [Actinomycetota bacterium]|nr:protoporphyrinogen oxidase [Actinomycetota bacterium]MDP2289358.1 protoporphyrinogen oxidase [Actinomycetota bacterium]